MALAKAIKKRRKATQNIHKITKTMELVATARLKGATQAFKSFSRYKEKALEMMARMDLQDLQHPLAMPRENPKKHITVLAITANRGLCGSYNTHLVEKVISFLGEAEKSKTTVELCMSGRKGLQYLKFHQIQPAHAYPNLPDQPKMQDLAPLADFFMDQFKSGQTDEVVVIYSHKLKLSTRVLLPFTHESSQNKRSEEFLFWPDQSALLAELVPMCIRLQLLEMFMNATISEQTSRMLAMKSATENAEDLIKRLTRQYNRARQTQITKEILEVLAGADALN